MSDNLLPVIAEAFQAGNTGSNPVGDIEVPAVWVDSSGQEYPGHSRESHHEGDHARHATPVQSLVATVFRAARKQLRKAIASLRRSRTQLRYAVTLNPTPPAQAAKIRALLVRFSQLEAEMWDALRTRDERAQEEFELGRVVA